MSRDKAYFIDIAKASELAISYVGNMTLDEFNPDLP